MRREGFADQLAQTDFDYDTVARDAADDAATIDAWDEKLEKVRRRIDRLGPINLAAIDEFKEQSERKEYLDSQLEDLNKALETLEKAPSARSTARPARVFVRLTTTSMPVSNDCIPETVLAAAMPTSS